MHVIKAVIRGFLKYLEILNNSKYPFEVQLFKATPETLMKCRALHLASKLVILETFLNNDFNCSGKLNVNQI